MHQNTQTPSEALTNEGLLTTTQAAKLVNQKPRFLEARRIRGGGPKFVRVSARSIRYRIKDVEDWIESRVRSSTTQEIGNQ